MTNYIEGSENGVKLHKVNKLVKHTEDSEILPRKSSAGQRDLTFDLIKGIGILAVIAGHFAPTTSRFVYSFHMPLFFIVAGIFFAPKDPLVLMKKDFKRLIIPFLIVVAILFAIGVPYAVVLKGDSIWDASIVRIVRPIYSTGLRYWFGPIKTGYESTGLLVWFLFALFWCRALYNVLVNKLKPTVLIIASLGLALLANFIDNHVFNLPFAFLPGVGAIVFFASGAWISRNKLKYKKSIILTFTLFACYWVYFILFENREPLDLYGSHYNNIILDIIGALGAAFIIWLLCKYVFSRLPWLNKFLAFLGMNSLLILCLHNIDRNFINGFSRGIPLGYLFAAVSTVIYIVAVFILYRFKRIKNVFGIKGWNDIEIKKSHDKV